MKFSAINAHFSSQSADPLGSKRFKASKRGIPLKVVILLILARLA